MNETSLRFLVENCPLWLSQHHPDGRFVAASPACEQLLGRSQSELLEIDLLQLADEADQPQLRSAWSQVCASQGEPEVRFQYRRPDGPVRWIAAKLRLVAARALDGSGEPPQVLCCARDVTTEVAAERARAERLAQAEQAERHRDYLVRMTPGLIWFGPVKPDLSSYHVEYMSEYLFRATGYTAKQWLETPGFWRSILHPEDRDRVLADAPAAMAEERASIPYRIFASDGRVMWVQSQLCLERSADGVPVRMYGLTLDMTAFQQAQHERMALQEELVRQAQRLLELSTPLIPISEEVLVMPVIGTLDPARAQHAQETVLNSVSKLRARRVLIDLTGVGLVDQSAVAALLRMVQAVQLLGAQAILTGVRAEVARAIITLGINLSSLATRASLREAIAEFVTSRPRRR